MAAVIAAMLVPLAFAATAMAQEPKRAAREARTDSSQHFDAGKIQPLEVTSRRIRNFDRSSDQKRFGKLEFRGGLVLTGSAKSFGGFSGIAIDPDGKHIVMVSDEAGWFSGEIVYEGQAPVDIRNARMGPIRAMAGRSLDRKRDADAEAVALIEGNLKRGTLLIGFERNHRIGRFPVIDGIVQPPTAYLKLPPEARRMRPNKGFEAVTQLQGGAHKGAVIAFSESFPGAISVHTGWIWIKGEPQRISITNADEFEITDVAALGDGSLLTLERKFRWSQWTEGVKMRLRRFLADEIRPGATPQGEVLLVADLGKEIDNMEGLTVHRGSRGETVLTLISDDNYSSFLQRTLLLQFTLLDAGTQAAKP